MRRAGGDKARGGGEERSWPPTRPPVTYPPRLPVSEVRNPNSAINMTADTQTTKGAPVFRRILLKASGEALMGAQSYGVDVEVARSIAGEIRDVRDLGVEVAVVVGGGNIFRGVSESAGNMDRASADYIGMLATVMNP